MIFPARPFGANDPFLGVPTFPMAEFRGIESPATCLRVGHPPGHYRGMTALGGCWPASQPPYTIAFAAGLSRTAERPTTRRKEHQSDRWILK